MSSPLSDLSEPPGSPEPFALPLSVLTDDPSAESQQEAAEATNFRAEDRSQIVPSVQAIQDIEAESARDTDIPPPRATMMDSTQDEVTIIEERSILRNEPVDISQDPQRIQNGNIVEVRWAGTAENGDLVIEVDENGYEIPKSDEVITEELQDATSEGKADDDLWDDGQRGARSLLDHCRGSESDLHSFFSTCADLGTSSVVMRCQPRYDDIGDLQYQQHPLFFQTMSAKQLEEIESHSPVSRLVLIVSSSELTASPNTGHQARY